ncbi:MAG TPA: glucosamine-6-phosphate deaminase [Verrucomicrobiae bacterium]|jgi:glucosamine-6-phosphate deaminase|nr:glucosamine-6-phosphate deaminase [Verrucomicrobiae bacterium]
MLVVLKSNYEELSQEAARIVANSVRQNPEVRLGLATGSTTIGVYRELARLHREEALDFSGVVTFNLDEYLGIAPEHPQSFHHFMNEHFFSRVNLDARNIHIPDGTISGDYEKYCAGYEDEIQRAGGIGLQILGIGRNGHIGFNEPTSSFASKTRLKVLNKATVEDNRKFFGAGEKMPRLAITMGIGTILASRRVLMLATGAAKAGAVANAIEGPLTASVTASALQLHPDATAIVDEGAAALLKQKDYYRDVMEMTALFTPGKLS